jgi:hypothetical protein
MNDEVGIIYLLHFDEPLGDISRPNMSASHYVGWAKDGKLGDRLNEHAHGTGARITKAAVDRGIGWSVVLLTDGTRSQERRLKKNGHHERRCFICSPKSRLARNTG